MTELFSQEGRLRLDDMVGPGLLCAFDFDGTLSPIVAQPGAARLPDVVRQRLVALMAYAPVAIITGRSLGDIRQRLQFDPDFVVGNHGIEGVPGWEDRTARHAELCSAWRQQLANVLSSSGLGEGIQVEDKRYSLSVHYRHARDPDAAASRLDKLFEELTPRPRVVSGKFVYNLLAEDVCHKGTALVRLMELSGARSALYVGDDVTDEDVFRLRREDVLSVRIEHSPETAANFFLPTVQDILSLLEELITRLRAQDARNWLQASAENKAP